METLDRLLGSVRELDTALRETASNGLLYPGVRNPGGQCIAAFRPKAVGIPVQARHLKYHWDGTRVVRYFNCATDRWSPVWPEG